MPGNEAPFASRATFSKYDKSAMAKRVLIKGVCVEFKDNFIPFRRMGTSLSLTLQSFESDA
jgi:hypothetical protein